MSEPTPIVESVRRKKSVYIGAPACFALESACKQVLEAFGGFGPTGLYLVGSAMERENWRDVDLRLIMPDEEFNRQFPDAGAHWEMDAKWLLLVEAISDLLKKRTGLPIDFQIQPMTHANKVHPGRRSAMGLTILKEK